MTRRISIALLCRAILSVLALVFLFSSPLSAQTSASIHPDPMVLEVGLGQVEGLNIVIENVKDLYGVEIQAHFDPSVVEVVSANPAQATIQLIPGSFVQPDFQVRNTADNKKGTLEYVLTQTNPTPPANGTGVLVTIQFRGKVLGKSSALVIDHVKFSDRHGQTIPVTPQNGKITVVQPKPPTPTPTLKVTPTLAPTETPVAVDETPEPDVAPRSSSQSANAISLLDIALVLIGCCGFIGAFVIVAIAAIVFFRRSKRRADPPDQYGDSQWR